MSEEKKVQLSRSKQIQNILFGMGAGYYMLSAARWYLSLCWHTRRKLNRYAGPPVCIELFGSDPENGLDILRDYGMRYAMGSLQWAVIENKVGLRLMFLVSQASFDYADCILDAYQGDTFDILTSAGSKRGQGIRKPYAQRVKRQAPPARKQAQLGKPYGK